MQSRHSHHPKLLQIQLNHRVRKHTGVFSGVSFRDIDDVRLQNDGVNAILTPPKLVDRRDATVVVEAVLAADDPEAEDVLLVVEDLEALGAGGGRNAGDHRDLPDAPHAAVANHPAALDEMLVLLRVIEPPHERPHHARRRVNMLRDERRACVGQGIEGVVAADQRL